MRSGGLGLGQERVPTEGPSAPPDPRGPWRSEGRGALDSTRGPGASKPGHKSKDGLAQLGPAPSSEEAPAFSSKKGLKETLLSWVSLGGFTREESKHQLSSSPAFPVLSVPFCLN